MIDSFFIFLPLLLLAWVLVLATVVRVILPREQLRDQIFVGSIGALMVFFTLAISPLFDAAGLQIPLGDLSGWSGWLIFFGLTVGIAGGALAMYYAIPRERRKALLPAFCLGIVVGSLPLLLRGY